VSDLATTTITPTDARLLTERIRSSVEGTWLLIREAYTTRAHAALGYVDWDDYCAKEFGASRLQLPREERQQIVASMRESGMSTRAIGSAIGVSQATAAREARESNDSPAPVIGRDGKTYSPRQVPQPDAPPVITDADHEFWDKALATAKASGALDRIIRERPYGRAVAGLSQAADQIARTTIDPVELGHNVPAHSRDYIDRIVEAHAWLGRFLDASETEIAS